MDQLCLKCISNALTKKNKYQTVHVFFGNHSDQKKHFPHGAHQGTFWQTSDRIKGNSTPGSWLNFDPLESNPAGLKRHHFRILVCNMIFWGVGDIKKNTLRRWRLGKQCWVRLTSWKWWANCPCCRTDYTSSASQLLLQFSILDELRSWNHSWTYLVCHCQLRVCNDIWVQYTASRDHKTTSSFCRISGFFLARKFCKSSLFIASTLLHL